MGKSLWNSFAIYFRYFLYVILLLGNDSAYGLADSILDAMKQYGNYGLVQEDTSEEELERFFQVQQREGKIGARFDLPFSFGDGTFDADASNIRKRVMRVARKYRILATFKEKEKDPFIQFNTNYHYLAELSDELVPARIEMILKNAKSEGYEGVYIDLPENGDFLRDTTRASRFYTSLFEASKTVGIRVATLPLRRIQKDRFKGNPTNFKIKRSEVHPVIYAMQFGFEAKFQKFLQNSADDFGLQPMHRLNYAELSNPHAKKSRDTLKHRVVAQLFNYTFADIEKRIPALYEAGYTHIHISPILASLKEKRWFGRYQPTDLRIIAGPLGDEAAYLRLIKALKECAKKHGYPEIQIIQDIALSHMAHYPSVVETEADNQEDINNAWDMKKWRDLVYPLPNSKDKMVRTFVKWNKSLGAWVRTKIMDPIFDSKNVEDVGDLSNASINVLEALNQTPNAKEYMKKVQAIFFRLNDNRVKLGLPSMNVGVGSEYVAYLTNWRDFVSKETAELVDQTLVDYQNYLLSNQGRSNREEDEYWHNFRMAMTYTLHPKSEHLMDLEAQNIRAYIIKICGDAIDAPPNINTLLEQRQALIRFKQFFGVVNWRMDALKHILKDYLRFLFADVLDFEGEEEPLLTEEQTVLGEIIPEGPEPWLEWMKGYADIVPNMLLYDFVFLERIKYALGLGGDLTSFITDNLLNAERDNIPVPIKLLMTYNHDLERNGDAFKRFVFEKDRMHDEVLALLFMFGMDGTPYIYSDRGAEFQETDETESDRYKDFFKKKFLKDMIQFKKITAGMELKWRQKLVYDRENVAIGTRGEEAFFVLNKSGEDYYMRSDIGLKDGIYFNLTADSVHHENGNHIKMPHLFVLESEDTQNHLKVPGRLGGMFVRVKDWNHAQEILDEDQQKILLDYLEFTELPENIARGFQ